MNKPLKITLIVLGTLFVLIGVPLIIIGYMITSTVQEVKEVFTTAYEDEDIIEYVDETHGIEVKVLANEGRDPTSLGGLGMNDAHVETIENDPVQFTVYISTFGKITGDNYEDVLLRMELNELLQQSASYKQLEDLGFYDIRFGDDESFPTFAMDVPYDLGLGDKETLQMLYDAIPIVKEWQDEAEKRGLEFDNIYLHGLQMDVNRQYKSWEDLGNKLAAENIDNFSYLFIDQDKEQVQQIESELQDVGFTIDTSDMLLECYKMEVYDECASYALIVHTDEDANENDVEFRYDDPKDRENLFKAIQIVRNVELPIQELIVEKVHLPHDPKYQDQTEGELEDREEHIHFANWDATIKNLEDISSKDDIYFEYGN